MTDALFISDRSNAFSKEFEDQGFACLQVSPQAFGSPYCVPCKLLIIPAGFADPKYYKILPAIERNAGKIAEFVGAGGILLVFGAILDDYTYDWLPMRLSYHMKFKEADVGMVDPLDPASTFIEPGRLYCDGYFTDHDGSVVMANSEGRPVLITKKIGEGWIVAASLHHMPSGRFLGWACGKTRGEYRI
ncbi:MAG TPA: hypothetical protein VK436_16810 [Methanocella sp.]|nr:hypothetical protein [Methanocella sp.]